MPGPRQSLDDYLRDRIVQLQGLGGSLREADGLLDEVAGEWGTLTAVVTFGELNLGFLAIFEDLELGADGTPHRIKYGYHCGHGDTFLFRYDFDPVPHPDMPYHKHLAPNERRIAADRVTLQDVVDELWPIVVERDQAHTEADIEREAGEDD